MMNNLNIIFQVIIAALYTSPNLVLETLKRPLGDTSQSLTSHFIRQWIHDTDCFLGKFREFEMVLRELELICTSSLKAFTIASSAFSACAR